jgi:hypothetical protein
MEKVINWQGDKEYQEIIEYRLNLEAGKGKNKIFPSIPIVL